MELDMGQLRFGLEMKTFHEFRNFLLTELAMWRNVRMMRRIAYNVFELKEAYTSLTAIPFRNGSGIEYVVKRFA